MTRLDHAARDHLTDFACRRYRAPGRPGFEAVVRQPGRGIHLGRFSDDSQLDGRYSARQSRILICRDSHTGQEEESHPESHDEATLPCVHHRALHAITLTSQSLVGQAGAPPPVPSDAPTCESRYSKQRAVRCMSATCGRPGNPPWGGSLLAGWQRHDSPRRYRNSGSSRTG